MLIRLWYSLNLLLSISVSAWLCLKGLDLDQVIAVISATWLSLRTTQEALGVAGQREWLRHGTRHVESLFWSKPKKREHAYVVWECPGKAHADITQSEDYFSDTSVFTFFCLPTTLHLQTTLQDFFLLLFFLLLEISSNHIQIKI